MSELLIQYVDGKTERRKLSRKEPLSIGKHASNDIIVNSEGVATLHCRISWNKNQFEVVAAGPDGLDVNGTQVRHAVLDEGAILRVGDADISIENGDSPKEKPPIDGSKTSKSETDDTPKLKAKDEYSDPEVGLSPISEEAVPAFMQRPREVREKQNKLRQEADKKKEQAKSESTPQQKKKETPTAKKPAETKKKSKPEKPKAPEPTEDALGIFDEPDFVDESPEPDPLDQLAADEVEKYDDEVEEKQLERIKPSESADEEEPKEKDKTPKWKKQNRRNARRPGEQELFKSPFVLALGGLSLVLLLAAGTYSFLILRNLAQNQFNAAESERKQSNFGRAIALYEEFITQYPRHSLTNKARISLAESRVESEISGSANRWAEGLEQLNAYIEDQRARDEFDGLASRFAGYAGTIAVGAAKDARRSNDWNLLKVAEASLALFERYALDGVAREDRLKEINSQMKQSENSIVEFEFTSGKIAQIDAAIEAGETRTGFQTWKALVLQYPKLENEKRITTRKEQLLKLELSQFVLEKPDQPANDPSNYARVTPNLTTLTIATRYRSRTDTQPGGEVVFALSNGLLVAFESMTGKPLWEKILGFDSAFFPINVEATSPVVLVHNSARSSLMLLNRNNGNIVWEQLLDEHPTASPLIHQGQVYVPVKSGLLQLDQNSGSLRSRLKFPQPPATTPTATASGEQLVVPGEQDVLYTLKLRPLECTSVTYSAHPKQSITHPLMRAGINLIASLNHQVNRTQLLVFTPDQQSDRWIIESRTAVPGAALDPPLLRGNRLFVPTRPERLTVFAVSDEQGTDALTQLTTTQLEEAVDVPVYLAAGPDDQVWMNSSAFRNYQLTADTLDANPKVVAAGYPSQPLQIRSTYLYVGRNLTYSTATVLTQMDRAKLTGLWRANVGAKVNLLQANMGNQRLLIINDLGEVVILTQSHIESGGFIESSSTQLDITQPSSEYMQSVELPSGTIAVTLSGESSTIWLLNSAGQVLNNYQVKGKINLPPLEINNRLLLALNGSIQVLKRNAGEPEIQPFQVPIQDGPTGSWRWIDRLSDTRFAALNESGDLSIFELRKGKSPHIARVVSTKLAPPASVAYLGKNKMATISNSKILNIFDDNLEIVSTIPLPSLPQGRLRVSGSFLFVTTTDGKLVSINTANLKTIAWTLENINAPLSGPPAVHSDVIAMAFEDGTFIKVDKQTGKEQLRSQTEFLYDSGPVIFGNSFVIGTQAGQLAVFPLSPPDPDKGDVP